MADEGDAVVEASKDDQKKQGDNEEIIEEEGSNQSRNCDNLHYQSDYGKQYKDYYPQYYQQRGNWMAIYDYSSQKYYYYNTDSKITQWDQPSEWDTSEVVDGTSDTVNELTGTGDSSSNESNTRKRSIADMVKIWLKRPARKQAEEQRKVHWRPEGAQEYNIWYDRWVGELWKGEKHGGPAVTRCNVKRDAGYTKANLMDNRESRHYWCIYFARGCCHLGSECTYYHTLPVDEDEKNIDLAHDVFGRERFRSHRDDMGGIGSFDKDTRTLYVGGLHHRDKQEAIVEEEFGEWGELDNVRYIPKLHIAFVRYRNRISAEFAKVAMSDQKFNGNEILNVRWAHDDPNPKARIQIAQDRQDIFLEAAKERELIPDEGPLPKRLRSDDIIGYYPNTDSQYTQKTNESGPKTREEVEQEILLRRVYEDYTRLDRVFQKMEDNTTKENHASRAADPYRSK